LDSAPRNPWGTRIRGCLRPFTGALKMLSGNTDINVHVNSPGRRTMFRLSYRPLLALAAIAAALLLVVGDADARAGRGGSFGSRGAQTYSAPPSTATSPGATRPMERSMTQPGQPGGTLAQRPAITSPTGGLFGRPGLMGGLFAGFLGAGLLGMLFGHGLFGGLGGFASMLGLLLQIGIIVLIGYLIWTWWQRRSQPAFASGPSLRESHSAYGGQQ